MRSFFSALEHFTGLGLSGFGSRVAGPLRRGELWWLPWIGLFVGLLSASIYFPLVWFYLSREVGILVALGFFSFLTGFRLEAAFATLCDQLGCGSDREARDRIMAERGLGAPGVMSMVFTLLLRFTIFSQFFSAEIWKLFVLGAVINFCAPTFCAAFSRLPPDDPEAFPRPGFLLTAFTYLFWIVTILLLVPEASFRPADTGDWFLYLRGAVAVALITTLVQGLLTLHLRERFGGTPGRMLLAASVPSELACYLAFLIVRYNFLHIGA